MRNYEPGKIIVTVGGIRLSGFADGSFVTAERNQQTYTLTVGADGKGARTKSNDRSGKVTLRLMQTSPSNDSLDALAALDEVSGTGVGALVVKDVLGTTLVHAESAWIQKPANVEFGKDMGEREWVFESDDLDMVSGGALDVTA